MHHNIPVVILCGGLGTRLREGDRIQTQTHGRDRRQIWETHEIMGVPMNPPMNPLFMDVPKAPPWLGVSRFRKMEKTFADLI